MNKATAAAAAAAATATTTTTTTTKSYVIVNWIAPINLIIVSLLEGDCQIEHGRHSATPWERKKELSRSTQEIPQANVHLAKSNCQVASTKRRNIFR